MSPCFFRRVTAMLSPAVLLALPAPIAAASPSLATLGRIPITFEPNRGQTDPRVRFLSRNGGTTVFLTATEAVFRFQSRQMPSTCTSCLERGTRAPVTEPETAVVRLALEGANPSSRSEGLLRQRGITNYYAGADHFGPGASGAEAVRATTRLPRFGQVLYHDVYRGIDLLFYGRRGGMEYDFHVAPGSDPARIRLRVDGAERAQLDGRGDLRLATRTGTLVQHAPVAYQVEAGGRRTVAASFVRRGGRSFGLRVGRYDHSRPLIIDPVLSYGTVFGGTADDSGNAVAVDKDGNILITGRTASADFPMKNAVNDQFHGPTDAFVTKISSAGDAIIYSTYFSGARNVSGNGIAVDQAGNAYVAGLYDKQHQVYQDIYSWDQDFLVFELSPTGQRLQGVFFGGIGDDVANGIAVGQDGRIYIAGQSDSWDYPDSPDNEGMPVTPNAFQKERLGSQDAYICCIDPTWNDFVYATYLGGDGNLVLETAAAIAVNGQGNAYVTGSAGPGFWVTPGSAYQASYGGGFFDAYVTEFTADGSGLVYSTLLGGEDLDQGTGIAVDAQGAAYVTGVTYSLHLPVSANAAQPEYHPGNCNPDIIPWRACDDSFVAKIDPTKAGAASLVYSTYLGGDKEDDAAAIAVDSHGHAWVTGRLLDLTFPEVNPLPTRGTGWESFVTEVSGDGTALLFSTYLGGSGTDWAHGIALDGADNVYVTGETDSADFPATASVQQTAMAGHNAFVVRIGASAVLPGDVDGNGALDVHDAAKALRDAAGLDRPDAQEVGRGDLADPRGQITIADAVALLHKLNGG